MSMLSGSVLGSSGDGPRRRHPVATALLVLLMLAVLFAATFGAVRLLKGGGSDTPAASSSSPGPCVTTTATPAATLPKPATITVNVYNATSRAGLARSTAKTLKSRGFGIGSVANDPLGKTLTTVAEIRYGAQGKDNALLMRYYVLGATLVLDQRTDTTVDVVLGQTFKSIPDQKVIDKALAAPVVVTSGSGCPTPSAKPASPAATRAASPSPAG